MPELLEKAALTSVANVTVTTTTETVAIGSGRVQVPTVTAKIHIKAWCQLTLGTGTTTVTPRIRQGAGITGTLLGEATAEAIKTAAGSSEPFVLEATESVQDVESVEYAFTVQQAGASANGTVVQAGIEVEVLNG